MKNKYLLVLVLIAIIGLIGYPIKGGNRGFSSNNNKIRVTASFYPLYYFAHQIGGDKADVKNITPAGSEPHEYDPSTQDIARIEQGNMLILNGGVEAWGDRIKDNLKGTNVNVVVAGEGLLTKELTEEGRTMRDPHVWLNPQLAKKEVEKITEGYIAIDSANSSYYGANKKELDNRLDQLDLEYKQGLQNCKSRDIITSHTAFAYLADAYGLNQVSISGLSPDEEPSAQQLAAITAFAKKNNVKYIFFESLVSPKLSETIANEVGAQTLVLNPLEGLSDEDMRQGKNYFTVMQDNLKNLQKALSCSR